MTKFIIVLINFYQKYFSPDHSALGKLKHPYGFCPFSPSCSEYAKQSLSRHGFIKGSIYSVFRIIRCNPWTI